MTGGALHAHTHTPSYPAFGLYCSNKHDSSLPFLALGITHCAVSDTRPEQQHFKSSTPLLTTSKLFLGACILHASAQLALLHLLDMLKAQPLLLACVHVRMSTRQNLAMQHVLTQ